MNEYNAGYFAQSKRDSNFVDVRHTYDNGDRSPEAIERALSRVPEKSREFVEGFMKAVLEKEQRYKGGRK